MFGSKELKWSDTILFHSNKKVAEIVQDTTYPHMWRIKWNDGVLSQDFYNKTRAKENAVIFYTSNQNKSVEEGGRSLTDAFF